MDNKKKIIARIKEWIRENREDMSYHHDPATPYEVVHINRLEDFLRELED